MSRSTYLFSYKAKEIFVIYNPHRQSTLRQRAAVSLDSHTLEVGRITQGERADRNVLGSEFQTSTRSYSKCLIAKKFRSCWHCGMFHTFVRRFSCKLEKFGSSKHHSVALGGPEHVGVVQLRLLILHPITILSLGHCNTEAYILLKLLTCTIACVSFYRWSINIGQYR